MKHKALWILMFVALAGPSPVFADAGSAVIARQACMKASTSGFNAMLPMFKGEKPFDAAAVPKVLKGIEFVCSDWKQFWPQDSQAVPGLKSRADATIWSDAIGFQRSSDAYFAALKILADAHDEASFKASFLALSHACSACHQNYRSPED